MSEGKLGRYITSKTFAERANAAVAKAVSGLEGRGIKPVYVERASPRHAVDEAGARGQHFERRRRVFELMRSPTGAHQVQAVTTMTAKY